MISLLPWLLVFYICSLFAREYIYIDEAKNWEDAQAHCRTLGTNLATILSPNELSMAVSTVTPSTVWIGLYDPLQNDNYIWINGEDCTISDGQCTDFWSTSVFGGHCVGLHTQEIFQRRLIIDDPQGFISIDCQWRTLPFLCNPIPTDQSIQTTETLTQQTIGNTVHIFQTTQSQIATTNVPNHVTNTQTIGSTVSAETTFGTTDNPTSATPTGSPSFVPTESPIVVRNAMNNDYIYVSMPKMSWKEAQRFCRKQYGTDLATIKDKNDIESVLSLMTDNKRVWMGMYSGHVSGWWKWMDDSRCIDTYSGVCVPGELWVNGEPRCIPDNDGYNCTYLATSDENKVDNDMECDEISAFVCNKYKIDSNSAVYHGLEVSDDNGQKNTYFGMNASELYIIFAFICGFVLMIGTLSMICYRNYSDKRRLYTLSKNEFGMNESDTDIDDDTDDEELDQILASSNSL